ncbi:MAG: SRPBCC family protein [Bacteroidales bacterium]|nr:SRPBCC family protein [Bacteroidales bacterium]
MHKLKKTQNISLPVQEAWEFFSQPDNIEKITPSNLHFKILSRSDAGEMYPGMIISYKVSSLSNLVVKWVTEVTQIKKHKYFIDHQIQGLYKIWHHEHHFKEIANGTEMKDILFYDVRFGFVGQLLHKIFIRKRIEEIFNYRELKIKELFGSG